MTFDRYTARMLECWQSQSDFVATDKWCCTTVTKIDQDQEREHTWGTQVPVSCVWANLQLLTGVRSICSNSSHWYDHQHYWCKVPEALHMTAFTGGAAQSRLLLRLQVVLWEDQALKKRYKETVDSLRHSRIVIDWDDDLEDVRRNSRCDERQGISWGVGYIRQQWSVFTISNTRYWGRTRGTATYNISQVFTVGGSYPSLTVTSSIPLQVCRGA